MELSAECGRWQRPGASRLPHHSPVRPPSEPDQELDRSGAEPEPDGSGAEPAAPTATRHEVFVGNWPHQLRELELSILFRKQGLQLVNLRMFRRSYVSDQSSFAFVELTSEREVRRAIELLHGGKVLNHQIIVRRSRQDTGVLPRGLTDALPTFDDDDGRRQWKTDAGTVELPAPPPPKMPKLVLPGPPESLRRTVAYSRQSLQCEVDGAAARRELVGSVCSTETASDLPFGASAASEAAAGLSPSATAVCERVRRRLHEPSEVVVANFPAGTTDLRLLTLFARYSPLRVRIMVNNSDSNPDHFTYAYLTLPSRMAADEAALSMDGCLCDGRRLVVEGLGGASGCRL